MRSCVNIPRGDITHLTGPRSRLLWSQGAFHIPFQVYNLSSTGDSRLKGSTPADLLLVVLGGQQSP